MDRLFIIVCGSIVASVLWGCSGAGQVPDRDAHPVRQNESRHWVQNRRLREIMDELDRLSVTQWPQEVQSELSADKSYHAAKAFWEARQLADGLSQAASSIPEAVKKVKMAEVDRRSFEVQVQTLREQGQRLKLTAVIGDSEGMRQALAHIDETCNSCHSRFRDISGAMPQR